MTVVATQIARARVAQRALEAGGQELADRAALAAAWAILKPENNRRLAEMAVCETGLGNVEDKVIKNHRKTLGLLRDMQGQRTIGIIREDRENGITEISRPLGVIAAITPSTNPAATPANNIINALKAGNAIILAPSPKGLPVAMALLELIHQEFKRAQLPLDNAADLVQTLPVAEREMSQELMRQADLVVVTGSQNNVRNGYKSGTPCLGVGAGNVTVIIDETADVAAAAAKIAASKTFDNATSCSSENSLILVASIAEQAVKELRAVGGVLLDASDKARLQSVLWQQGGLNRNLLAKGAATLIAAIDDVRAQDGLAALTGVENARFLMVQENAIGSDAPYSGEKMAPVLTLYQAADYPAAVATAEQLLMHQGGGHSVGIHTADDNRAVALGLQLPACRVIVNQAHCFATGGAFNNGLPFSLSMGCGTWGGNSFSGNFNFRHLSQQVQVARVIPVREPTLKDIFADYWQIVGETINE
ncbi:MAG: aldehyde dehydrogenase family protein [Proteobacteria bacterium]|nr:aldehyde dehydrogenase family protein [Pseudomonadota bacterium]